MVIDIDTANDSDTDFDTAIDIDYDTDIDTTNGICLSATCIRAIMNMMHM